MVLMLYKDYGATDTGRGKGLLIYTLHHLNEFKFHTRSLAMAGERPVTTFHEPAGLVNEDFFELAGTLVNSTLLTVKFPCPGRPILIDEIHVGLKRY